ncbi:pyruvate kinase-like protein [Tricladium varicosporioides]|nr:pyruvate kinase-like protein [Hymenoscyphus varicosporioides]
MSVVATSLSTTHGLKQQPVGSVYLLKDQGIKYDIHCSPGSNPSNMRQVLLLSSSQLEMLSSSTDRLAPGALGENLLLTLPPKEDLQGLPPGTTLAFSSGTVVKVTEWRMPKKRPEEWPAGVLGKCKRNGIGRFGVVVEGGEVKAGDKFTVTPP